MLVQPTEDKTNVLQCGSTTLSETQKGYAIIELELLALVWSLEKFSYFLHGAHDIKIFSDHAPLSGLEKKDLSAVSNQRVVRMLEKTRGFCFSIHYIKGIKKLVRRLLEQAADEWSREGRGVPSLWSILFSQEGV